MPKGLNDLIKHFAFWLIFFASGRLLFFLYHWHKTQLLPLKTVALSFYHALLLDISAASYLSIIPVLLFLLRNQFYFPWTRRIFKIYVISMVVLVSLVTTADLQLYREWGSKINAQALYFLKYPREAMASVASSPLLLLSFLFLLQIFFGVFLFRLFWKPGIQEEAVTSRKRYTSAGIFAILLLLIFTGIRGGWQLIPVNQSAAYFSNLPFANHASLNTSWNLLYSMNNTGTKESIEIYSFMASNEAAKFVDSLYRNNEVCAPVEILRFKRPNVVLIILESWTADVVESLGGEKNITPGFEKLIKEGILFTNFYASGDRTDKGLVAILSGFPAQPQSSIVTQPEKVEKLPRLTSYFNGAGYKTSFYYGGESEFANMKAYLLSMAFHRITDKTGFKSEELNSKWGAHDHIVFQKAATELAQEKQPFFSAIMTLSSHEPFQIPMPGVFPGNDEATLFRNAVYYSDKSLAEFISRSKTEGWYDSTLFILVADHGHRLPKDLGLFDPRRFSIPLLLTGGALKDEMRGTRNQNLGSQTDIPGSILAQLSIPQHEFSWSRNLFCSDVPGFAFYSFNNGFGWAEPNYMIVYENVSGLILFEKGNGSRDSALIHGKAYMQRLMEQYLK